MKYLGSKNRIAKEILPIILEHYEDGMCFIDCCVGGGNLLDKVPQHIEKYGNDINEYLVEMWNSISNGWLPTEVISEELYDFVKNNKNDYPKDLVAYIGFSMSFGGKWFAGYRRDFAGTKDNPKLKLENELNQSRRSLQAEKFKGVKFSCKQITDILPTKRAILYCDPPYEGTTGYKDKFNHKEFWDWCRKMGSLGHQVFVSEYNAPEDFTCVWSKEVSTTISKQTSKKDVEKLFTFSAKNK
jgi:DNA adenine methylase